jgi:hypothetical protein
MDGTMSTGHTIRIAFHALEAADPENAIDVARGLMIANVIDAHEYLCESCASDDDFADDHDTDPDFMPRYLVTFCRDF